MSGTALTRREVRFGPLEIAFDDAVLVPRQWTLAQARWAVALLAQLPDGPVLELCAGVTALAGRSIAGERPIDE